MLEKDALSIIIDKLKADHFYKPAHAMVYSAISRLYSAVDPVDVLTVTEQMRKDGTIEKVNGPWFITQLTNKVSSTANLEYHAMIIIEKYIMRQIIAVGALAQTKGFDHEVDPFYIVGQAGVESVFIAAVVHKKGAALAKHVLAESAANLEKEEKKKRPSCRYTYWF